MFLEVAILRPVASTYTYKIPPSLEDKIELGQLVVVPFGYGQVDGIVLDINSVRPKFKTKEIIAIKIAEPVLKESLTKLTLWMMDYYQIFPESILRLMVPSDLKTQEISDESPARQDFQVPKLTKNEEEAVHNIKSAARQKYLLFTSTNKERHKLYLKLYSELSESNNTLMFFFPEISQAEDFYNSFIKHIDTEVVFWHAKLTPKQKLNIWWRCRTNKIRCLIGTRSMVYLPVEHIKLIAVDEEESPFYKSEKNPKYMLSEVALVRAKYEKAIYLIGTSAPGVEAYAQIKEGEIKLSEKMEFLDLRRKERKFEVDIIDIREEHKRGHRGFLSPRLRKRVIESKKNNEKIILFYNRRGYSTYVSCRECGQELSCPRCSKPLVYDQKKRFLCHVCNFVLEHKPVCSNCSGSNFKYSGAGTQKIISEIKHVIFNSNVIRLDKDSLTKEENVLQKYKEFIKNDSSILIGTQLVFHPNLEHKIDLFAFLNFDQIINFPDYHVAERAYQTLIKAKELLSKDKGKIIIQTRHPDHYVLKSFLSQNYEEFYNEEIKRRKELNYPPFTKLAKALIWGDDLEEVKNTAQLIYKKLNVKGRKNNYQMFEPMEAPTQKVRDKYYWQLIFKGDDLKILRQDFSEIMGNIKLNNKLGVILDIDPARI